MRRTTSRGFARLLTVATVVMGSFSIMSPAAHAAAGDLDFTFDGNGNLDLPAAHNVRSIELQQDGKILALHGFSGTFGVSRVLPADGTFDSTFGSGGRVTLGTGSGNNTHRDMALQADGKIIVAGDDTASTDRWWIFARLNTDGTLDETFGTAGWTSLNLAESIGLNAIAVQPDGAIVAAGWMGNDLAVARFTQDGDIDPTFDTDGFVRTSFASRDKLRAHAHDVTIAADGSILVTGRAETGAGFGVDVTLVRYTTTGALDTSFGTGGIVITDILGDDRGNTVAIQPDGSIVVGGSSAGDFAILRYLAGGTLDPSFGTGGSHVLQISGFAEMNQVKVQADGKLVGIGTASDNDVRRWMVAVRWLPDGTLDNGFGTNGVAMPTIAPATWAYAGAIQSDGNIVLGGQGCAFGTCNAGIARFQGEHPDLSIDDVTRTESDGTQTVTFTVTLAPEQWTSSVTVAYATVDGTATAGSDYVATSGTLSFPPNVTSRTVNVTLAGDLAPEATEQFSVQLSSPTGAVLADAIGTATIIDEDTADVAVAMTDAPDPASTGGTITYTILVTGEGPSEASNVVMTDKLPRGLSFTSMSTTRGSCTSKRGTVTCAIGSLSPGSTATVTIVVTAGRKPVTVTNTATVVADQFDPDTADNSATVTTTTVK